MKVQVRSKRDEKSDDICYDPQGNIETLTRNAPTMPHPEGTAVDQLTYTYTARTNRLASVFDENDNLQSWNLGGAAGLVGRADPNPWLQYPVRSYYVTDHLGSIRAVLNASGTVIEGRDYYPYGLTMPGRFYVQADTTREGFTSYEQDKETGFYYAGARFYNPALGRFLTTDKFQERYPGLSPYQYAAGNPVSIIDVNGDTLFVRGDQEAIEGFVQVANASMGGHHLVSVGADGMVNVTDTGIEGSMTEQQQAFYDALMGAASLDVGAVNISLVMNDPRVLIGSYPFSAIDMADVMAMGEGPVFSSSGGLGHELSEQTYLQLNQPEVYSALSGVRAQYENFDDLSINCSTMSAIDTNIGAAHSHAIMVENQIMGVSNRIVFVDTINNLAGSGALGHTVMRNGVDSSGLLKIVRYNVGGVMQ